VTKKDRRRRFNKAERVALFLTSNGRSDISGKLLEDHWQADHIMPWSRGGKTTIMNAQTSNPAENQQKGSQFSFSYSELRKWQKRFVDKYELSNKKDFMLGVIPAGGKTLAASFVAASKLLANPSRKIIVVSSTRIVKRNWKHVLSKYFNIQIESETKKFDGSLAPDFQGISTTYQAVAMCPLVYARFCNRHDCFVIWDEIHHAGINLENPNLNWAAAIQEAFEKRTWGLPLSGTPFRSDDFKIPFLEMEGNGYKIDFKYDYPEALEDKIVRRITFHRYHGKLDVVSYGEPETWDTKDDLSREKSGKFLSRVLWEKEYAIGLLEEAHNLLLQARIKSYRAGCLVLCINIAHANQVASWLKELTGEEPDIILSDEEVANSTVDEFSSSNKKFLVTVKEISEGVDIPRLIGLAWMANTRAPLFFRQGCGRIMRRQGIHDRKAFCVIPVDPILEENALEIEVFQSQVFEEDDEKPKDPSNPREPGVSSTFTTGCYPPEYAGMTTAGKEYDRALSNEIKDIANAAGITESEAAIVWEMIQSKQEKPLKVESIENETIPLEDKKRIVRNQCNELANIITNLRKEEPGFIYKDVVKQIHNSFSFTSQKKMTLAQLEEKKIWLTRYLTNLTKKYEKKS
jgi:superfamily II DNA or RNA helicase